MGSKMSFKYLIRPITTTSPWITVRKSHALKLCKSYVLFFANGSQLAKMKKSIPNMSLPWNLQGWSSWSKMLQIYFKNYDFCEYVKFGAISWKIDIFVNNCLIEVQI